ncbi:hypothetical protein LTR05_007377 [Lithohypha guttulata]|uniref:Piwi domain-containing protein n=1 Tax=Lithohypha guttulata TaxID=1690604 RepID=A0AAN7SV76_9EURO|nr:hypothetical protein LTR05_007377 [Lithohypha guttulata]
MSSKKKKQSKGKHKLGEPTDDPVQNQDVPGNSQRKTFQGSHTHSTAISEVSSETSYQKPALPVSPFNTGHVVTSDVPAASDTPAKLSTLDKDVKPLHQCSQEEMLELYSLEELKSAREHKTEYYLTLNRVDRESWSKKMRKIIKLKEMQDNSLQTASGQPSQSQHNLGAPQLSTDASQDISIRSLPDAHMSDVALDGSALGSETAPGPPSAVDKSKHTIPVAEADLVGKDIAARLFPESLQSNHFQINLNDLTTLHRYTFSEPTEYQESQEAEQPSAAELAADNHPQEEKKQRKLRARGRRRLYALLLKQLEEASLFVATDYMSQIVSTTRLDNYEEDSTHSIPYFDEDQFEDDVGLPCFMLTVSKHQELDVQAADQYLRYGRLDPGTDYSTRENAQRAVGVIADALNIIFSNPANQSTLRFASKPGQGNNVTRGKEPTVSHIGAQKFYPIPQNPTLSDPRKGPSPWTIKSPSVSPGLYAGIGYFRSVRPSIGRGFLLNVNAITGCFYQSLPLKQLIDTFCSRSLPSWKEVEEFISGLRVQSKYMVRSVQSGIETPKRQPARERIYTISGLPREANNPGQIIGAQNPGPLLRDVQFKMRNGKGEEIMTNVFDYWKPRKLLSDDEVIVRVGKDERPVYFPASELEVLPGQERKGKLDMVFESCRSPSINFGYVQNDARNVLGLGSIGDHFAATAETSLIKVDAHLLKQPNPVFHNDKLPKTIVDALKKKGPVNKASWNLMDVQFRTAGKDIRWASIHVGETSFNFRQFDSVNSMIKTKLPVYGMKGAECGDSRGLASEDQGKWHNFYRVNPATRQVETHLTTMLKNAREAWKAEIVFVYLSDDAAQDAMIYAMIKRVADIEIGIPTICISSKNRSLNPRDAANKIPEMESLVGNLMLKPNVKIHESNVNHSISSLGADQNRPKLLSKRTMIVGLDVTHAGAGAMKEAPSIAAMVVNRNGDFAQWPACLKLNPVIDGTNNLGQKCRKANENVEDAGEMLKDRLRCWRKHNEQQWPERIIVYRDGLSESQFENCKNGEIQKMRSALYREAQTSGVECPKILVICTVKRHHVRFLAKDSRSDVSDRNQNAKSGTAIFGDVTRGDGHDFFLMSQNVIQGTGRPTHYVVLRNEIPNISIEDIAQATYDLCFMWARGTSAVGLVPPSYYADLAATRGRHYMHSIYNDWSGSQTVFTGFREKPKPDHVLRSKIEPHADVRDRMLYI